MQKWEYLYVVAVKEQVIQVNGDYLKEPNNFVPYLQSIGIDGWELAGVTTDTNTTDYFHNWRLIFKRQLF